MARIVAVGFRAGEQVIDRVIRAGGVDMKNDAVAVAFR
jgi:hypothetical protein